MYDVVSNATKRKKNRAVYDMLGNLTHAPNATASDRTDYVYNDDNLLELIDCVQAGTSNTTAMTWDADQQRLRITKGANTWEMVYDAVAGIPAVLLSKNYVNSSTSYVYYVRGPGGELLTSFDAEGANVRYYHFDALGSTVLASNGSSATTASVSYDAWGEPWSVYGTSTAPYRYVGELGYYSHTSAQGGDSLQNLLQLGVRFYDPQLGRFTQRDVADLEGQAVYTYSGGNPISNVDPNGDLLEQRIFKKFCYGGHTDQLRREMLKQKGDRKLVGAYEDHGKAVCQWIAVGRIRIYYRTTSKCVYFVWRIDLPSCRRSTEIWFGEETKYWDKVIDAGIIGSEVTVPFQYPGQSPRAACLAAVKR